MIWRSMIWRWLEDQWFEDDLKINDLKTIDLKFNGLKINDLKMIWRWFEDMRIQFIKLSTIMIYRDCFYFVADLLKIKCCLRYCLENKVKRVYHDFG